MIRNAVLHLENEQPLIGDLYRLPEPTDVGLLCTNVRTLDGRRPVFIDDVGSAFFFPYRVIRFIELPAGATSAVGQERVDTVGSDATPQSTDGQDLDLELDEEFLRRVKAI